MRGAPGVRWSTGFWALSDRDSWAGRLANGFRSRPMVPTMPPFFLLGRVIIPGWKKEQA